MKRRLVIHLGAEWPQRSVSAEIARSPQLCDVDADRPKHIDRYIDYFGGGAARAAQPSRRIRAFDWS